MPDTKVSALTPLTGANIVGTETLPVAEGTTGNKSVTPRALQRFSQRNSIYGAHSPHYSLSTDLYDGGLYLPSTSGNPFTVATAFSGWVFYVKFRPKVDRTYTELCFTVTTAGAGVNGRIGLYNASTTEPTKPTTLITQSGDLSCATTGKKTFAISQALSADNTYFLATNFGTATTAITVGGGFPMSNEGVLLTATGAGTIGGLFLTGTAYGAMAADVSASALTTNLNGNILFPVMGIK